MESLRTEVMTPDELAEVTRLPLFRIRSDPRELVQARWVQETEGRYKATQDGLREYEELSRQVGSCHINCLVYS